MSVSIKGYEVYVCKNGSEVVYIGEGRFGRHKHCNSGTSHVYELNKLHFDGVVLEVDVVKVIDFDFNDDCKVVTVKLGSHMIQ